MTRRGSQKQDDPRLLIAILAVALGLLASHVISKIPVATSSARTVPVSLLALSALTVCLSIVAPALLRVRFTRLALRRRIAFALVPADEFDPEPETVLRFAAQLARVDRGVRGWVDRPGSSIRLRMELDGDGRLVYLIEVPRRARELVRSAVRSFDGIELRDPAATVGTAGAGTGGGGDGAVTTLRAELILARPSVEPLARLGLDPDPLQAVAAAMHPVRVAEGETAAVLVDLLPAAPRRRARLRRRLEREGRRMPTRPGKKMLGVLDGAGRDSRSEPIELAERRAEARALDNKLKDGGPLFEAQMLVRVVAEPARARAVIRGLLASFEPLASDRNWLRVSGLPIPGLGFLGSDLPGRRQGFDRRARSALFRPARRCVVSARELIGWLKPPTLRCTARNVLRSGALVAPPPPLDPFDGEPDLIPIGTVAAEDGNRVVGVSTAETFFSYAVGRSRYGKTELAIGQFLHLVRRGHGGLFIDPHADALERIKPYLTEAGIRERVVEINLSGNRAAEGQPGWNVLGVSGGAGDPEGRVEAVVDAFSSALRWDERNSRALNLTTQAVQALGAIGQALPAELAPTIFQLPTFLSDEAWRNAALPLLSRPARQFWTERFPRLAIEAITPVTNLVDRLRASTPITSLLGQSRSSFSAREAMDNGAIVLVCPGAGGTRDRLIANLMIFDFLRAAKSRVDLPPERRRPFYIFCDEVQTYDGASGGNLAANIEQVAKYKVRWFLLNQDPDRLSIDTRDAILTNRSVILATALNSKAAKLIATELGGRLSPAALTGLDRFHFLAQVTHEGELSEPFAVRGVRAEDLFGRGRPDELGDLADAIDANAGRRRAVEVLADLDTLDDRILTALTRPGDTPKGGSRRRGAFRIPNGGGEH